MKTDILRIDIHKPDSRGILKITKVLDQGGIIIYPTDSVYTLGCKIDSKDGYLKLCKLKDVKPEKAQFSIVCSDFSHLSEFAKQIDNSQFRILKHYLPGPYTFILEASKEASRYFHYPKKTIGIRIPNIPLIIELISQIQMPIFSASIQLKIDSPYATSAEELLNEYDGLVDLIIDGGLCGEVPTTIVDLSTSPPHIVRQGSGIFE